MSGKATKEPAKPAEASKPAAASKPAEASQPAESARPAEGSQHGRGRAARGMTAGDHDTIHLLLSQHGSITRTVKEIPGGVRTTTTTDRPELVEPLRRHVRQMAQRLEEGRPIRMWDPVFRDVFASADEINLKWKDIKGGIEVTETSEDPDVVPVIRAHAKKVNDFVDRGHAAARPPWAGGRRR